jgi:hypothetical protein
MTFRKLFLLTSSHYGYHTDTCVFNDNGGYPTVVTNDNKSVSIMTANRPKTGVEPTPESSSKLNIRR